MATIHKVQRREAKMAKLRSVDTTLAAIKLRALDREITAMIRADHLLFDSGALKTRAPCSRKVDRRTKEWRDGAPERRRRALAALAAVRTAPAWIPPPGHTYRPNGELYMLLRDCEVGATVDLSHWRIESAQSTLDPAQWDIQPAAVGCTARRIAPAPAPE